MRLETEAQIVARETPYITKLACGYAAWGTPVEDLVQEGLIALVLAFRKWSAERPSLTFSCEGPVRNAMRSCIGLVKENGRTRLQPREDHRSLDAIGEGDVCLYDLLESAPSQEVEILEKEKRTIATKALDALPARQRQALELRVVDELPLRDVGKRLGITSQAAGALEKRAVANLSRVAA